MIKDFHPREKSPEMEDQIPHFQSGWLASQLSIHPLRPRAKPRLSPPLRYHHFAFQAKGLGKSIFVGS